MSARGKRKSAMGEDDDYIDWSSIDVGLGQIPQNHSTLFDSVYSVCLLNLPGEVNNVPVITSVSIGCLYSTSSVAASLLHAKPSASRGDTQPLRQEGV